MLDRGSSILVDTQARKGHDAQSALLALIQTLIAQGRPERLRFDRDTRFVGSWGMGDFPSAMLRFILCMDIVPIICPPRRPDLKPFVERCIKTLKHESLFIERPANAEAAHDVLKEYTFFYNSERPNQSTACANAPSMLLIRAYPS